MISSLVILPFFKNGLKPNDDSRAIARHVNSLNSKSLSKFAFTQLSSNGRVYLIAPIHQLNEIKTPFSKTSSPPFKGLLRKTETL